MNAPSFFAQAFFFIIFLFSLQNMAAQDDRLFASAHRTSHHTYKKSLLQFSENQTKKVADIVQEEISAAEKLRAIIYLIDDNQNIVKEENLILKKGWNTWKADLHHVPSGYYTLYVRSESCWITRRVWVNR